MLREGLQKVYILVTPEVMWSKYSAEVWPKRARVQLKLNLGHASSLGTLPTGPPPTVMTLQ